METILFYAIGNYQIRIQKYEYESEVSYRLTALYNGGENVAFSKLYKTEKQAEKQAGKYFFQKLGINPLL